MRYFLRGKKAHKLFTHKLSVPPFVPGIVPGTNRVCPRDKPGEIGLPLCRIRRIPGFVPVFTGFVPGTNWVCPRDKSGENWDQPDKKNYVYVPFSCLNFGALPARFETTKFLGTPKVSTARCNSGFGS